VDFILADTRQYRDGGDMLGPDQEHWLLTRLKSSAARWKVLAQAVFFAPRKFPLEPPSTDAWDGYPESRARVLAAAPDGLVVLTGDVHNNWACELERGVEFVGTSVTSMPGTTDASAILALNPHIKFFDGHRGYVSCVASTEEFRADYRVVDFVDRAGAPVRTVAGFRVVDGHLQRTDV
jgi:alkaline phosphatase D